MPPMRLCGRHWHFASDDLLVPAVLSFFANTINILLCGVACDWQIDVDGEAIEIVLAFSLVVSVACLVLDVAISCVSSRGGIFEPKKRKGAGPLLLLRGWLALVPQAGSVVALTVALAMSTERDGLVSSMLVLQWAALCFVLACLLVTHDGNSPDSDEAFHRALRWLLSFLGWCVGAGRDDETFCIVGKLLLRFLEGISATGSDVLAGVVLVGVLQRADREGGDVPKLSDLHLDDFPWGDADEMLLARSCGGAMPKTMPVRTDERSTVEDLLHNLCYATAVYGWLMHLHSGRGSMRHASVAGHGGGNHILNCKAIAATLTEWPGHSLSSLIFLSDKDDIHVSPYAVFADAERKKIVVAVRGTLSISDVLIDVCADPHPVEDPAFSSISGSHFVHRGMWDAAKNIMKDLDDRHMLEALLLSDGVAVLEKGAASPPDCNGFGLVVVGHSLGAGIAQLLTALLLPKYPEVRCFHYGTPGPCSREIAEHIGSGRVDGAPRVIGCTAGDDAIARLSIRNAEMLRDRMLGLTAHCHLAKFKVMVRGLRSWNVSLCRLIAKEPVSVEARASLERHARKGSSPRFYHMGPLVYLRMVGRGSRCCATMSYERDWRAEWATSDDFQEMVVSTKMLAHHMPDVYRAALESAQTLPAGASLAVASLAVATSS